MILLDTNIISEALKATVDIKVRQWLSSQRQSDLYLSSITLAEMAFGINRLDSGQRKIKLETNFKRVAQEDFAGRIVVFDTTSAWISGEFRAKREKMGMPISLADSAIAATAITHGLTLATRNTKDFEGLDLKLINPFAP